MVTCCQVFQNIKRMNSTPLIIPLLGIENSGKSTLVSRLKSEFGDTKPTIGFQPTTFFIRQSIHSVGREVTLYDLGGGPKIRGIWKNYFAECHALTFLIDMSSLPKRPSHRPTTTTSARPTTANTNTSNSPVLKQLQSLLAETIKYHSFARGKPVLVLLNNKQSTTQSSKTVLDTIVDIQLNLPSLCTDEDESRILRLYEFDIDQRFESVHEKLRSGQYDFIVEEVSLQGLFHPPTNSDLVDVNISVKQAYSKQSSKDNTGDARKRSGKVEPVEVVKSAEINKEKSNELAAALIPQDPRIIRALWTLIAHVDLKMECLSEKIKADQLEQKRLYAQERYDRMRAIKSTS